MSGFEVVQPGRRILEEEPLTENEIDMLAEGYPPSTLAGLDHEEVVIHMARRLLDGFEELADVIAQRDQAQQELRDEIGG